MQESESPRSDNKGGGRAGGGVEAREGRGDDALEESTKGVEGADGSLGFTDG